MKTRIAMTGLVVTIGLLLATNRAVAQNPEVAEDGMDASLWHVEWTNWLALPFMNGNASVAGSSVDLDLGPSEIFDKADSVFGAQVRLEVWHDNRFGLMIESMGSLIEAEQTIRTSPVLPAIPAGGVTVDLDWELVFVDIEGAYRIYEGPLGQTPGPSHQTRLTDFSCLRVLALLGLRV